jgi:hypothetical protein
MDGLLNLFSAFGLASAAGFNAYVPLLAVGLVSRYTELLKLAEPFDVLAHPIVLVVLGVLAVVDFAADKIPTIDHLWHGLGVLVNPIAGAILFASQNNTLTEVHPALAAAAGLVIAGGFHGGRAAVRPLATATTGGTMNPVLSFLEDMLSAGLSFFAIFLPGVAVVLVVVLAAAFAFIAFKALRHLRESRATRGPSRSP